MFCCFLSLRSSSNIKRKNEEKQSFLTSGTTINYRTVSPYADVIKDDIIQIESPNVVDTNATDTLLFNGTMPDRTTRSLSFDNDNTNPNVLATQTNNGPCLLERLFSINHVSAVNSSKNISMSSIKSSKTNSSDAVAMARPFDEFSADVTSGNPLEGQGFGTTKSDKD